MSAWLAAPDESRSRMTRGCVECIIQMLRRLVVFLAFESRTDGRFWLSSLFSLFRRLWLVAWHNERDATCHAGLVLCLNVCNELLPAGCLALRDVTDHSSCCQFCQATAISARGKRLFGRVQLEDGVAT